VSTSVVTSGAVLTGAGSAAADAFVEAFEALGAAAPLPDRFAALRREGLEQFAALGFPTTKNEDWHYTSVARIAEQPFTIVPSATGAVTREQVDAFGFGEASRAWHTFAFVNGRFAPELSSVGTLPAGLVVRDLATAWESSPELLDRLGQLAHAETRSFTALNTAFLHDGAVIAIDDGVSVAQPIHLLFIVDATAAKTMMHPRVLMTVGANANATVIESYVATSDAMSLTNAVGEVFLGDGATLRHYKIQREGQRAYHVGTTEVTQGRDSHYVSFSFATGGALSRTNLYTTLDGEGCGVTLNGLYLLDGEQHCDHQTLVVHAQPNCFSRELYKGILDGRSHGVFNGKVYVHPIAQQTDGKQTSKTLLLSDTAHIDTKPQLEIFADDVKCTHGATVGQIDQQALFYMKSRGVGAEDARRLLTYAFAADALETIEVDAVREGLERMTLDRYL
jgi:Fe-S cluster assembly protein SufD